MMQGFRLEEVEAFLDWKYRGKRGEVEKALMRRTRSGIEQAHRLNKGITQEGLSAEDMLKAYMAITPDDLNFLHEFQDINKAIPIYEYVLNTHLSELRARWFQLRDGNEKLGILSKDAREFRVKVLDEDIQHGTELTWDKEALRKKIEDIKKGTKEGPGIEENKKKLGTLDGKEKAALQMLIQEQEKRIQELNEKGQATETYERNQKSMTEENFQDWSKKEKEKTQKAISDFGLERVRLEEEIKDLGYGVALWGSDWDFDAKKFTEVYNKKIQIDKLRRNPHRTHGEQKELEALDAKRIEYEALMAKSRTPEEQKRAEFLKKRMDEEQDIVDNYGFSSLEIKVKKQMMLQKEMELRKILKQDWTKSEEELNSYVKKQLQDAEFEMNTKMAILMARYDFVYTRHVVSIASNYRLVGEGKGSAKYSMRSEVLEDMVRVHAWQTFFKRFNMGGEAGATAMAIFNRETQFHKTKDGNFLKLSESKGFWARLMDSAKTHPEQRATLDAVEAWEKKSGISFAQVLNNQILKGGGVYDASTWRAEIGVTDEMRPLLLNFVNDLRASAQKEGTTAVLDNAGMAFQFAVADRKTEAGLAKRMYFLEKMRKRDPLIFMEYMAEERYNLLLEQPYTSASGEPLVDFDILSQALSLANNDINLNKKLLVSPDIDLGGKDFHTFVVPYIEQLLKERGMTGDIGKYKEFIQEMMKIAKEKATVWAGTDFPMTLRMGDLDWSETDYHKTGMLSMARRGRDNVGMYKAASILREFMSNHELLFHPDPNKVIEKLLEMEKEMIGYTGNDDAAQAFTDSLATYIRMNEFRTRRTVGWTPGGIAEWGLRQLSDTPEAYIKAGVDVFTFPLGLFVWSKEKRELIRQGLMKKINGNLISYAVEYGSAHGNSFDEKAVATIIRTAQDRGGFLGKKKLAHDLMHEFKVGLGYRWLGSIRKYYWIIFVTILAAAIATAVKEEEKQH